MAFLLGNESCIESLRCDLTDIQETIDEILVRSGPVRCYSWKSPDKMATDLKIKELLDRYKYSDDEVDNQVAHYTLLELIVDRLLLLVYLSGNYAESSLVSVSNGEAMPSGNNKVTRLSAGLSIKKFWNKYTQLCTTLRQLNCQNKTSIAKQQKQIDETRLSQSQQVNKAAKKIADEVSNKSVQTNETAFVPCESCAKVQTNLKQNADQIINMCHYQNIVSQVGKYRQSLMANQLVGGWLNGSDLEKWLIEQDKDLSKLSKQLEYLSKNNELLKGKLTDNEATLNKMTTNEKELKKNIKEEQESRTIMMKQYEKKLVDQKAELDSKIKNLRNELKDLNELKTNLEQKYDSLKTLNDNNEKIIVELNETNKTLSEELNVKNDHQQRLQKLEEEKLITTTELECLKRELNEKSNDLTSERSKLEAIIRNEQSLKLKYEACLESLDKLTVETENAKKKQQAVDAEKNKLLEEIRSKEAQIEEFQFNSEMLQNSINNLKMEIKKNKENELLLLRYPDLYGPVEQIDENELNVCEDMMNQINANKHRISLLEELNRKLQISIKKLNENNKPQSRAGSTNKYDTNDDISNNYFMKKEQERRRSVDQEIQIDEDPTPRPESNINTPKYQEQQLVLTRPVPLFKLENEINETEFRNNYTVNRESKPPMGAKQNWSQDESYISNRNSSGRKINQPEQLRATPTNGQSRIKEKRSMSINNMNVESIDTELDKNELNEDDDDFDFLKDKHKSDKNFLDQLNKINQNSELKVESAEYNYLKNRRNISSRDHNSSFLFSPSQASVNSDRNSNNPSRASNYSAAGNRFNLKTPPIPPADKNMEVVVGKGRRVNSAVASARSNSAVNNTSRNNMPPNGLSARNKKDFKCENCDKKYSNNKDLDIHKLYCSSSKKNSA